MSKLYLVLTLITLCLLGWLHPITIQANSFLNCDTVEACDEMLDDLKNQMNQIIQDAAQKEDEQTQLQSQRYALRNEVIKIQTTIVELKGNILQLEDQIAEHMAQKNQLELEIATQKDRLFTQLRWIERFNRKNVFLTMLSETESLTDLIKNYRFIYHVSKDSKAKVDALNESVSTLNMILKELETNKTLLVQQRSSLETKEMELVEKMNELIEMERQLQQEIQQLQSLKMETDEIKTIIEEQKRAMLNETNDSFGIPLASGYVTCEFGCYVDKNGIPHNGIDMGNYGNTSTPVVASAGGTVTRAGWHNAYGNYVMITHNIGGQIFTTVYGHMHSFPLVHVGQSVTKGQKLGTMGNTGNSSGPHLHFELYKGYYNWPHSVNPRDYISFPRYW